MEKAESREPGGDSGDVAVVLNNIRKSYRVGFTRRRKVAVEDLSLRVEAGGIFGLLGPNGAGKSTTLKVILGIVYPDSGGGSLLGRPLGDRAAHGRIGFLPEQPYFYGFLTAEQALDLYSRFFGMERDARSARSAELLDLVGLGRDSHLTLDKYSKGMLQRFGIAQALLNDPELVIMDEPSSGLDPVGQKEIRDILLRLKDEGKTIFMSSHQLSEVENICDSVSIISRGRTVRQGRLSDLLTFKEITRITVGGADDRAKERFKPLARDIEQREGPVVIDVDSEAVYRALDLCGDLGLQLISVTPYRRTLEDLFMEAIREKKD